MFLIRLVKIQQIISSQQDLQSPHLGTLRMEQESFKSTVDSELSSIVVSSLIKIITSENNYHGTLIKLYQWYRKNSQEGQATFTIKNRHLALEDDWEVRKTFQTSAKSQLETYQRKNLDISQIYNFTSTSSMFKSVTSSLLAKAIKTDVTFRGSINKLGIETNYTNFNKQQKGSSKQQKDSKQQRDNNKKFQLLQFSDSFLKVNHSLRNSRLKRQQSRLRQYRQEQQLSTFQRGWKQSKSQQQQRCLLNFYKGQFNKGKIFSKQKIINRTDCFSEIKQKKLRKLGILKNFQDANSNNNINILQPIDGLNLMQNPYQQKIIKKK